MEVIDKANLKRKKRPAKPRAFLQAKQGGKTQEADHIKLWLCVSIQNIIAYKIRIT